MGEQLVVNASRFPHETMDGETILIDSETGHVLLLKGFAAVLLSHMVGGAEAEALTEAVEAQFGGEAASATRAFLGELHAAGIVVVATTGETTDATAPLPWPGEFTVPALERYDDIAKIIAMDPIHDVGPAGWPRLDDTSGA